MSIEYEIVNVGTILIQIVKTRIKWTLTEEQDIVRPVKI